MDGENTSCQPGGPATLALRAIGMETYVLCRSIQPLVPQGRPNGNDLPPLQGLGQSQPRGAEPPWDPCDRPARAPLPLCLRKLRMRCDVRDGTLGWWRAGPDGPRATALTCDQATRSTPPSRLRDAP